MCTSAVWRESEGGDCEQPLMVVMCTFAVEATVLCSTSEDNPEFSCSPLWVSLSVLTVSPITHIFAMLFHASGVFSTAIVSLLMLGLWRYTVYISYRFQSCIAVYGPSLCTVHGVGGSVHHVVSLGIYCRILCCFSPSIWVFPLLETPTLLLFCGAE